MKENQMARTHVRGYEINGAHFSIKTETPSRAETAGREWMRKFLKSWSRKKQFSPARKPAKNKKRRPVARPPF
jgi:hypothetical protein